MAHNEIESKHNPKGTMDDDFEQHRCKECGCPLGMKAKISLESCPIGAWTENNEAWMNGGFNKFIEDMQKRENS